MGCCGYRECGKRLEEQEEEEEASLAKYLDDYGDEDERLRNYRHYMLNFSLDHYENFRIEEIKKY